VDAATIFARAHRIGNPVTCPFEAIPIVLPSVTVAGAFRLTPVTVSRIVRGHPFAVLVPECGPVRF
jgi:hypothetical protein